MNLVTIFTILDRQNRQFKLAIFFAFWLLIFIFPASTHAAANPQSYEITISASIGEPKLTLFGYSSPNSLVQLSGQQVQEEVIAQENGYFIFDRLFLPSPHPEYPELCLNAVDTQSRISFPVCLPRLPIGPFNISVGPVLISPTFSLGNTYAEGLTIPNSEVAVFLANDSQFLRSRIVKKVEAYSLPQYKIKSDSQGRFEFSLPTAKVGNWRLFASAEFQGSPTPKSNTLNFKILSWWQWLLLILTNLFRAFLRLIKPFWWLAVVLLEMIIATWLLIKRKALIRRKR